MSQGGPGGAVLDLPWGRVDRDTPPAEGFTLAELWARRGEAEMRRTQRPAFHLVVQAVDAPVELAVDFHAVRLRPCEVVHVHPGQVVRWAPPRPGRDGASVLVVPAETVDDAPGWYPGAPPAVTRLRAEHARELTDAFAVLRREVERSDAGDPAAASLVRALARVVVLRATRGRSVGPGVGAPPVAYSDFRAALERTLGTTHVVAEIAAASGWSTRTVTRACREVTGRGAKHLLDERLALEARRLLAHSDLPVAEIGARLGWSEATNFGKAFRRVTGQTPAAARARLRDTLG